MGTTAADSSLRETVSVIVPCRNEARYLRHFLESMLNQETASLDIEFLIAEGMSTDGSREIIEEYRRRDARIRVIDNPGLVVSTGLNLAIEAARGSVVLRMDAHTEFDSNYIRECVRVLRETGAENVGGAARTIAEKPLERAIAAAYRSPFSTGGARFHNPDYEGPVDTVTYGCWRREVLERLGGFDETLIRNQDDELNLRIVRRGGIVWQSKRIISYYHPRGNLRSLFKQYFQYGFWKIAVIRKHHLPASWRHLVPAMFVATLGFLTIAALAAKLGAFDRAAHLMLLLLAGTIASYLACIAYFSWRTARVSGMDLFRWLPAVFIVYHISYGLGFLTGVVSWLKGSSEAGQTDARFAELSR